MTKSMNKGHGHSIIANKALALTCIFGLGSVPIAGPALVAFGHWRGIEAIIKTGKHYFPDHARKVSDFLDEKNVIFTGEFAESLREPLNMRNRRIATKIIRHNLK